MLTTICLLAALVAISAVDLRHRRIPDALSLPLIAAGLALAAMQVRTGAPSHVVTDRLIGATAGYLLFAVIGALFFRFRQVDGLGLGDAKLLAAAGAWLGWPLLPAVVLIAACGGLAQAAVQMMLAIRTDGSLAFGPWLAVGFFALWIAKMWHGDVLFLTAF